MCLGLALELEPGPLYALRNWGSLQRLCQVLDSRRDGIGGVVGLNLDVAHWSLAEIDPKKVLDSKVVLRRILHAHASDHGRGHFGDVEVGTIHGREHFASWLNVVQQAARIQETDLPPRSGYVSIELEACKDRDMVKRSATFLRANRLLS